MNIALIGASGFIGSALLAEALARGHSVTAVVTKPEKLTASPKLRAIACDVH
ncbi:MAG: NAD-dependent epimerase/dehydratase family protein, partial [Comamonadaceae bacterium]